MLKKIFRKIDEKQMAYSGYSVFYPDTVYFVVNNICNLRCMFCDIGQKNIESSFSQILARDDKWITEENVDEIAIKLSGIAKIVHINSTEPILEKQIYRLIASLKKRGALVYMTTGGATLMKRMSEFLESGLDRLYLSIDGPQEIHDVIRGAPGLYGNVTRCIRKIREESNIEVIVPSIVTENNYTRLFEHAGNMKELGVNEFYCSHLSFLSEQQMIKQNQLFPVYSGPATKFSVENFKSIDFDLMYQQLELVKSLNSDNFRTGISPDFTRSNLEKYYVSLDQVSPMEKCNAGSSYIQVLANGDVNPMTRCVSSIVFGNIRENDFHSIWNGKKLRDFRRIVKKQLMPACLRCGGAY